MQGASSLARPYLAQIELAGQGPGPSLLPSDRVWQLTTAKTGLQARLLAWAGCRPRPRLLTAARAARPAGDALWLPNTERPAWLDGSLPGDRGFDPLGLARPAEYLQIDVSVRRPPWSRGSGVRGCPCAAQLMVLP